MISNTAVSSPTCQGMGSYSWLAVGIHCRAITICLAIIFFTIGFRAYAGPGTSPSSGTQSNTNSTAPSGQGQSTPSVSFGGTILAYQSLKAIGTNIAEEITSAIAPDTNTWSKKFTNGVVYITTTPPNNSGLQASYFFEKTVFKIMISKYLNNSVFSNALSTVTNSGPESETNQSGNAAPLFAVSPVTVSTSASDMATAASTILGLFRTGIATTDNSITPDNLGLLPSLCSKLSDNGIKPITADFYVDGSALLNADSLLSTLMLAAEIRAFANQFVTNTDASSSNQIVLLDATYDNLYTNLTTQPLASFIPLDLLYSTLSQTNAYLLYISNDYAIGEMRVKSNPITDIFFDGPRVSFIGGAGVSYFLYKGTDATPIISDHLDGYRGYKQFSKFTLWNYVPNDLGK